MSFKKKLKPDQFNAYGYYNDEHEYVILRPDTPKPWINYLSNPVYHALVSQTGGGYSYYRDSKLHRILNWQDHRKDRPGRYIFLKDQKTQEAWSANWQPLRQRLDYWQAKHAFGSSSIFSEHRGIRTEITYFVPPEDPCEVWLVTLKNKSTTKRSLSVMPYVHWLLGDYYMEVSHKNIMLLYNEGYFDPSQNAIIAFKHQSSARKYETYGFFATSEKPTGYELSYEAFVGPYGSLGSPRYLKKSKPSNQPIRGEEMIGLFDHSLELAPHEEKTFVFVLGFTEKKEEIPSIIQRNISVKNAKQRLGQTKELWKNKLSSIQIQTPDPHFDRMTNTWGQYQLLQITRWRSASYYAAGEGGRGYRDTAQDVEGAVSIDPFLSKEWIEKLLGYQYPSGHAVAGYSDIEGPWEIGSNTGILGKGDVACWIPFMVSAYVKETGDFSFLQKRFPFLEGGEGTPLVGTVWDHCLRAIDHFWKSRGEHGLPLFWKADWNDAFDRCGIQGKGESVWLAMAYCRALKTMEELADLLKESSTAEEMRRRYEEMSTIVNDIGWDGDWYLRLFTDGGRVIGSKSCEEGKIFINTQSWAILSGVAPELRAEKCLKSVEKHLDSEMGPALFWPAYQKYDPEIGRITAFAPGTKENAAVFSHAAAFLVVAYAMMKKGEKTYDLFSKIAPYNPAKEVHRYKTEPYIYAEYCYGPGNSQFGLGAFNWNTGTAPWMFLAATQWILGVRPTFEGLLIDPCIPKSWEEVSIHRIFRGAVYEIRIKNPKHLESGVEEIFIDGKKIEGNIIPQLPAGKVYHVEVLMG